MKKQIVTAVTNWDRVAVACCGISGITAMEIVALSKGIDGIMLTATIASIAAIIAGFCGFRLGKGGD